MSIMFPQLLDFVQVILILSNHTCNDDFCAVIVHLDLYILCIMICLLCSFNTRITYLLYDNARTGGEKLKIHFKNVHLTKICQSM